MRVYYNEIDAYCVAWLRNLMDAGAIARGDIDTRSIEDVRPDELAGYDQCHFFAGLGGWAYAVELAGWTHRKLWTGSCPCQPFSSAGKGAGFEDERHLWPAWFHLIAQCGPAVVVGEQVASKAADAWIDLVQADVENLDYAYGCIPFPAAGLKAPGIRDRNYWMANLFGERLEERRRFGAVPGKPIGSVQRKTAVGGSVRPAFRVVDSFGPGSSELGRGWNESAGSSQGDSVLRMADSAGERRQQEGQRVATQERDGATGDGLDRRSDALAGFWGNADWLFCRDGKWRPVEPGTFPLAHGVSSRVGRLRAYGNAINPHQAALFLQACDDALNDQLGGASYA